MKYCKKCQVQLLDDNAQNCCLCGASLYESEQTSTLAHAPYCSTSRRPANKTVRDIFAGISTMAIVLSLIISIISSKWTYLAYAVLAIIFVWYAILLHIFDKHSLREILDTSICTSIVYISGFMIYFGYGQQVLEYVLPLGIIILIGTEYMVSWIGAKFRIYCLSVLIYSILGIVWFIINFYSGYNWWLALAVLILCVISILGIFIFARKTLFIQLNKIFRM